MESRVRYKIEVVAVVKGKERYLTVTSSTGIDRYASNTTQAVAGYDVYGPSSVVNNLSMDYALEVHQLISMQFQNSLKCPR